jgi:hypothetical protein
VAVWLKGIFVFIKSHCEALASLPHIHLTAVGACQFVYAGLSAFTWYIPSKIWPYQLSKQCLVHGIDFLLQNKQYSTYESSWFCSGIPRNCMFVSIWILPAYIGFKGHLENSMRVNFTMCFFYI